jgi:hypothetical protein
MSIPTNNLKLWLDATLVTGNIITDQSGQTGDWSLNNSQSVPNAVNNLSSIKLNSSGSSIVAPDSVGFSSFNFMHSSSAHIFGIMKLGSFNRLSSISNSSILITTYDDNSSGPGYRLFFGTNAKRGSGITTHISKGVSGSYAVGLSAFGQMLQNNWYLFHINTNPSASASNRGSITINNLSYANNRFSDTPSSANSSSKLKIVASSDDPNANFGEIGELLIYSGTMTGNDIDTVKNYLADKWSLSENIIRITPTPTATPTATPGPTPTTTPTPTPTSSPDGIKHITNSSTKYSTPKISGFDIDAAGLRYFHCTTAGEVMSTSLSNNRLLQYAQLTHPIRSCAYDSVSNTIYVGINNNSSSGVNSVVTALDADTLSVKSSNSQSVTGIQSPVATKLVVSSSVGKLYGKIEKRLDNITKQQVVMWRTTDLSSFTSILSNISMVYDMVVDEANGKLYISANINSVDKIYQVDTTTNALLQSWNIYAKSLYVSNNLLMYTTNDSLYFMDLSNQTTLFSYQLHVPKAGRFTRNGPYSLAYDPDGYLYVFDAYARDNEPKFLLFNTINYSYVGTYGFVGPSTTFGVSSAKYISGLRKILAMYTDNYLYNICPENLINNSLFSRKTLPGKCDNSTGFVGKATIDINSISPWIISGSDVSVISMSYCNKSEQYNPFVSLGASSGSGYIEQSFNTVSGYDYLVEFKMGNTPGFTSTSDKMAKVSLSNSNNQTIYDQIFAIKSVVVGKTYASLGWQSKSFVFTANSATTKIRFSSPNSAISAGGSTIDHVIVTRVTYASSPLPTPAPSPSNPGDQISSFNWNYNIKSLTATNGPILSKTLPSFNGGVLVDNENAVFVPFSSNSVGLYNIDNNTYTDGAVHGKGTAAFIGGVLYGNNVLMIPYNSSNIGIYNVGKDYYSDGPVASGFAGGVLTSQENLVMAPYSSSTIGLYNPSTNAYTNGPAHNQGSNAVFAGAVSLNNGKVLLVPHNATNVGIYDPSNNSYTNGPAHNAGSSAYFGGVLIPSLNKVVLIPQNATNISIYDITANSLTAGPAHNQGTLAFAGGVLLPNNNVLLIPYNSSYYGIYNPINNTYTNGARSPTTTGKFVGGLLVSGNKVLPCPANSNIITYIRFGATAAVNGSLLRSRLINKL